MDTFLQRRAMRRLDHKIAILADVAALRRTAHLLRILDDKGQADMLGEMTVYSLTACSRSVAMLADRLELDDVSLAELYDQVTGSSATTHTRPATVTALSAGSAPAGPSPHLPTSTSAFILSPHGKQLPEPPEGWAPDLGEPWTCPACNADTWQGAPRTCGYCGFVSS